ncbi:MAG: FAD-dependent oxidoreductase [Methylocystis sp.]|uniref:flavin monoamine oxidase family protein n=1 Tax=Methylocystis sp. TaxID=1911079 RepID=UPI00394B9A39
MLDVAIVGAGVSGLALARRLRQRGLNFEIFEARDRIGGRIFTVPARGAGLDLGAGWYWPETQPLVAALVAELGLSNYAQYDEGGVLHLREADKKAERIDDKRLYDGARRLHGGMTTLVDAIARSLPTEAIKLNHRLTHISDRGDHVALTFTTGEDSVDVFARQAVLSLPPRLLRETVDFAPPLDEATDRAMLGAETWMAAQAKVAIEVAAPFWRERGLSGSAYATHEQAILGEVFDACDMSKQLFALGGFLALDAGLRETFSVGLPLLIASQLGSIFGADVECLATHYVDWAQEPLTCSAADRAGEPSDQTGDVANPLLRRALWDKKLYFGGSETAVRNSGYIEGALDSARRVARALAALAEKQGLVAGADSEAIAHLGLNEASLIQFRGWVDGRSDAIFEDYRRRLTKGLASRERDSLTQIALLGAIEDVFQQALAVLDSLPFDLATTKVELGRVELVPRIQQPFGDLMQTIMDDVVAYNQTSCALSNFPSEHRLSGEYKSAILQDIAGAWREFSLTANRRLLERKNSACVGAPAND